MPRFELLRLLEDTIDVVESVLFSVIIWGVKLKFRTLVIDGHDDIHFRDAKREVKNALSFHDKAGEFIDRLRKLNQSPHFPI